MANYNARNGFYKAIGKLVSLLFGCALVFILGIVIAAVVKDSTFTAEWANMVAWFRTWAK